MPTRVAARRGGDDAGDRRTARSPPSRESRSDGRHLHLEPADDIDPDHDYAVRVSLDRDRDGTPGSGFEWTAIRVSGVDAWFRRRSDGRARLVAGGGPGRAPSGRRRVLPPMTDYYGIAIGIDSYPSLRRLTSSVGDATQFCDGSPTKTAAMSRPTTSSCPSPDRRSPDRFDAEASRRTKSITCSGIWRVGLGNASGSGCISICRARLRPAFDNVGMLMASASMDTLR